MLPWLVLFVPFPTILCQISSHLVSFRLVPSRFVSFHLFARLCIFSYQLIRTMANVSWFFERMEEERESFACVEIYVPSRLSAFKPWSELLMEDEERLSQRSAAARSVRRRVKSLLIDICSTLGVEVFALATFSAPMSKLYKVDAKTVLPGLCTWWKNNSHPESLACLSRDLVKKFDFAQVIPVSIATAPSLDLPILSPQRAESDDFRRPQSSVCFICG